ncbi:YqaJ-like viral recombinase domain [Popillia japonica]|uniref:YqaJ-like viral recombinase domain n=1 Tax=Popillia japonica TaxID=7064 RepID=A0AAW1N090_POPJA
MRYNNGFLWHNSPWKRTMKCSPGTYMKQFLKSQSKYKKKLTFKRQKRKAGYIETASKRNLDYGPNASQPELSVNAMNDACNQFLETLKVEAASQLQIMNSNVGQFDNPHYRIVKSILSSSHFTSEAIEFGKMHEHVAISILEEKLNEKVSSSGLCVDIEYPFLGASPDGFVGQDRIVEVKCLFKVSKEKLNLSEAAQTLNICLEWKDNRLSLKRNHNYFFQIQGQLHISNKEMCYFVVFVNQNEMFVEEIKLEEIK